VSRLVSPALTSKHCDLVSFAYPVQITCSLACSKACACVYCLCNCLAVPKLLIPGAVGHFVDRRTRCQLGLSGAQLLSQRECTRDPDWQLVRLTLLGFASGAEVRPPSPAAACAASGQVLRA